MKIRKKNTQLTILDYIDLNETYSELNYDNVISISNQISQEYKIQIDETEDLFRIESLGLEWDFGVGIYQPKNPVNIAVGPDDLKIGIFMIHGGDGDYKLMAPVARSYAQLGHKVVVMSLPGRLNLEDQSRDWPGDTILPDGSLRTPIWKAGEYMTADQYDIVSDDTKSLRYGKRILARAKVGSLFYLRMAGWPAAFEVGAAEAMSRHLPEHDFSIYGTGHSTGGPHIFMMCQRVPNMAGIFAVEHSPFGVIQARQHAWSGSLGKITGYDRVSTKPAPRHDPFNELYIRTWRDIARYKGPEALGKEGPAALMRLPSLMEEVLDAWEVAKKRPQFKSEYIITHNIESSLLSAARATAKNLNLSEKETQLLEDRFAGFPHPLNGPNVRNVPPIIFIITKNSRDHSLDVYREVILPSFAELMPSTKLKLVQLGAGVHTYWEAEPNLPLGVAPIAAKINHEAIMKGFFHGK